MSGLGNKAIMGKNIERHMRIHNIDRKQLSENLSIPYTTLTDWINGNTYPRIDRIEQMARYFNVPKRELVESSEDSSLLPPNIIPMPKMKKVPLIGTIACGAPIYAEEQYGQFADVDSDVHCDFALRASGDSLDIKNLLSNGVNGVRLQDTVNDGEIAAVILDDEATLKRIRRIPGGITALEACNPTYAPIYIGAPGETRTARILGKAVAFQGYI